MDNLIEVIIPKTKAQSVDATAQPTFGQLEIINGGTTGARVIINSEKTSVNVGDKFTVTVRIETKAIEINMYKVVLDFDPGLFSVIDNDINVNGTQVKLLDTLFLPQTPETDNSVSLSTGRITVLAKTQSGNGFTANKDVIAIEFQSQKVGSGKISVVQGTTGTQLVRPNGSPITFTVNEITVSSTVKTTPNDNNQNNQNNNQNNQQTNNPINVIPNTAIGDNIVSLIPITFGTICIILGAKLFTGKKNKQ